MKNTSEHILFGPSGCLSREGLLLLATGRLNEKEMAEVNSHVQTCEFCAMAIEGMVMANPEEFNQDLEFIYASLKEANVEFPGTELKKIANNQEFKKMPIPQKSFFRRYRLQAIAAILLLLLAIGARQLYLDLSPGNQQSELARVEPDDVDEMEVIQQGITRREPLTVERLEKRPTPLKPVQIREVSDDLELIMVDQEDIYAPVAEASKSNDLENVVSDAVQKEHNASAAVMHMQDKMGEEEGVAIFIMVEDAPEFPGGDNKRIEFLTQNIKYPQKAREFGIQGTVYVGFVVEKDGSINDARVLRGIGKGCEEEALRVIRLMPKWKPGTQRNHPVRVQVNLPVTFSLGV